ncbi:unnamed protein product [Closterium sp. NIES-65]|nr:unnamed protein product [Closterium sp. NIES-65]
MSPFPRHYLRPPFTRRTSRTLPVSPPITHFVTFSLTLKRPLVALPFSPPVTHLVAYALASKSRRTLVASHVSPPITHIIVVALSPQCPLVAHSRLSSPIALPLALKRPRGSLLHSPPITHFVAFALALSRPPVAYHLSTPIPSPSCSPLISPSNRALRFCRPLSGPKSSYAANNPNLSRSLQNLHKLPPRLCLSPSPAIALTFSPSPAIALTFSPSPAIALTFSPSPAIALTFSPSPAIALTFSPSPAIALTFSPSPAIALTFSPSPAIALTFSPSPAIALTFSPSPAIALTFSPSPAIALTFSPSPAIPLTFSHLRTTFALMVSPPISLVLTFSSLIAFSLAPPVPSCCPRVLPSRPVAFALAPPVPYRRPRALPSPMPLPSPNHSRFLQKAQYVCAMPASEAQSQGAAERDGASSDRVASTIATSLLSLAAPKPLVSFLRSPLHAALLCLPVIAFLLLLVRQPVAVEHIAIHSVEEQYRLESQGEQKGSPASQDSPASHEQLQRRVDELLASWAAQLAKSSPTVPDPVASDTEGSRQLVASPPPGIAASPAALVSAPHLADCTANARVHAEEHWASRPADGSEPPWAALRRYAGAGEGEGAEEGVGEREGEGSGDAEKGGEGEGGKRESEIGGSSAWAVRREEDVAERRGEARGDVAVVEGPFPPWVEGADADNYPLTRLVQRDLWRHQFPRNCSHPAVRRVAPAHPRGRCAAFLLAPVEGSARHGLGTQMTLLAGALALAVRSRRVLVIAHAGARGRGRGGVGLLGGFERAEHEGCEREGMRGEWRCYFLAETSDECRRRAHSLARRAASFQGAHPLLATTKHPSLAAPTPFQQAGGSGEGQGDEQGRGEEEGAEGENGGEEESGGRQRRRKRGTRPLFFPAVPSRWGQPWLAIPGVVEAEGRLIVTNRMKSAASVPPLPPPLPPSLPLSKPLLRTVLLSRCVSTADTCSCACHRLPSMPPQTSPCSGSPQHPTRCTMHCSPLTPSTLPPPRPLRSNTHRWWRAQAARFFLRAPSPRLCRLLNAQRHLSYGRLAAAAVAQAELAASQADVVLSQGLAQADVAVAQADATVAEEDQALGDGEMPNTGLRASAALTAGPSDSSSLWKIAPGPMERQLWWRVRVPWVPRALVSMHVRMGDKGREMRVAGAAEYVRLLLRVRRHDPHARFVWLATEMQPVVEQLSGMGGWRWFTTAVPRMVGNDSMPAYERALGVQRSTDNALVNLLLAGEADYFIGALGSSWSFLLDSLRCTAGKMRRGFLSVNVSPRW